MTTSRNGEFFWEPSNHLLGNATPYADHLVRFVRAARCNLLATPNTIAIWTGQEKPHCTCGKRENANITLRHILNDCDYHARAYMKRHNGIMQVIWDLISETTNIEVIAEDSTTNAGLNLKPDLVVKTQEQIIIIDTTCPYGGSLLRQDEDEEVRRQGRSLEKTFQAKYTKVHTIERNPQRKIWRSDWNPTHRSQRIGSSIQAGR